MNFSYIKSHRKLFVTSVLLSCGFLLVYGAENRSVTIDLPDADYQLTYSIHWGLSMEERFYFKRRWLPIISHSSDWLGIPERPYNTSIMLYFSREKKTYYLGHGNFVFTFDVLTGELRRHCNSEGIVEYTELSDRFRRMTYDERRRELDLLTPGAKERPQMARKNLTGDYPTAPPASLFYRGLDYVGEFTLIYEESKSQRGNDAGFIPSSKAPERPYGLSGTCG
ncbi:hypothetical protein [Methylocystis sp. Sn-Cys]|uniref:hypothetical protein n=1 Tax=Methylocystis sp. Sn-Cys TaxID=1701263 RepID=UPI00192307FB|nr:hypothetical protein [Methylocystis sp. Sn-Cys]MBL1255376.1 hypothetical protein [Methylocystis sp. Sn-Cys]